MLNDLINIKCPKTIIQSYIKKDLVKDLILKKESKNIIIRRKRDARKVHDDARKAQSLTGIKAKIFNKQRFKEKVAMKKSIKAHE